MEMGCFCLVRTPDIVVRVLDGKGDSFAWSSASLCVAIRKWSHGMYCDGGHRHLPDIPGHDSWKRDPPFTQASNDDRRQLRHTHAHCWMDHCSPGHFENPSDTNLVSLEYWGQCTDVHSSVLVLRCEAVGFMGISVKTRRFERAPHLPVARYLVLSARVLRDHLS